MHVNMNTIIYYYYCTASSDPGFTCAYSTRYDMLSQVYGSVREKPWGGKQREHFLLYNAGPAGQTRGSDVWVSRKTSRVMMT